VQAKELFNHQEQEEHSGQAQPGEVLPVLPQAYRAQGNQGVIKIQNVKCKFKKKAKTAILNFQF
jgi:hypothetical protein